MRRRQSRRFPSRGVVGPATPLATAPLTLPLASYMTPSASLVPLLLPSWLRWHRRSSRRGSPSTAITPTTLLRPQPIGTGRDRSGPVRARTAMMGTECIAATHSEDSEPSIPPGFGPFAALALRGIQNDVKPADIHSTSVQILQSIRKDSEECQSSSGVSRSDTPCSTSGGNTCRKSLRNRPPIDYSRFEHNSDEDSDVEVAEKGVSSVRRRQQLPKGVLRGCAECSDCQNVIARWNPDGARRPVLDEAPVFYPTEEEFKDTLKYIESIRPLAEPYGICRIVPPSSWKPTCLLKDKSKWEGSKFSTRVQKVDKLQNRKSSKKSRRGGMTKKRRKLSETEENNTIGHSQIGIQQNPERFGFEPGPEFTLQTFQKYADDFSEQYFRKDASMDSVPSVEEIEGEYWRIVEKPTEEIEVIYGADLETGTFGSGFPKLSLELKSDVEDKYAQSGWNLNNLPRLQGSVLSFEGGDISGVLVPWVYVGMCFSSFCWHVEDHHLYSLNYMHWGAPKMCNLICYTTWLLSFHHHYSNLKEYKYTVVSNMKAIGQNAVELYREQARKITISHDKLLLGAAREAIKAQWDILFLKRNTADNMKWKNICGPDSTICKALKVRIETELAQRKNLGCPTPSQSRKMDPEFDSTDRECALCYYDLHLSACGCPCCPETYACLVHAKQLCSCDWDKRFFLFRYDVNELNILADALGGKLSAIHRWGVSDLGLSLSSCVKREKVQDSKTVRKSADGPRRSYMSQASAVSLVPSFACNEQKDEGNKILKIPSPQTNSACPSVEQMKFENISPLREPCMRNELSYPTNTDTNKLQGNGGLGGHKGSAPGLLVLSSQPFSFDVAARPISTLSESKKIVQGLVASKVCIEASNKLQGNGGLGGHKGSAPGLLVLSSQPFSFDVAARPISTLSESKKIVQGLVASKVCIEASSRAGDSRSLIGGEHHNRSPMMIHDGANMNSSFENLSNSHRLMASDYNATPCHSSNDQVVVSPATNASVMTVKDSSQVNTVSSQQFVQTFPWTQSTSHETSATVSAPKPFVDLSVVKSPSGSFTPGSAHLVTPTFGNQQQNGHLQRTSEPLPCMEGRARGHPTVMAQPALESHSRNGGAQKGPRIANVVHRFKCSVELLEIGVVLSGRLWSSNQAIFPKGFRSRVKYFSILDPIQMTYYMSEILDAGMQGPLFMVTVENCPGEVFINFSPSKCWNMVRERLNMEVRRQLSMGRPNLPTLQPPGSIDGIEMFGLSSPSIVQAIEARDRDRICTEYWRSRPHGGIEDPNNRHMLPQGPPHLALRGLFQRANRDELRALRGLLTSNGNMDDSSRQQAAHIIDEEMQGNGADKE
ncbi:hypothetical protein GUJ93_ZPchr0010g9654 [Zizania palustris]|uniref:JmjN domain-containing protein n=1 Tax=Zizania palustris TaxID=103762 RepID=A0A8J6BHN8_ZIZPA|nr:hypothetical protein GUJ93_ZPchr0010g9654 [Zizania palustris]